ncbi:uncharacterized protein LOC133516508 isoform X1 [Cydia pomonella]|uniref:uncharacterized protein LOC133516508 isoform X1 n=1 Tax=Cydia pomonella TaxID=82600 RepID=UPI002ADE59C1|nr:uncharacterized protein LOC133516508 isoform X1 [Cydia pomonella]
MKPIVALCFMILLGQVVARPRGPCGCKPMFEFCANDYTTYHSICEYKCKHPYTPFHDWYILYDGPCFSTSETTTRASTTTKRRRSTTTFNRPDDSLTTSNNING